MNFFIGYMIVFQAVILLAIAVEIAKFREDFQKVTKRKK